jgi:KDO2-lipid IV(A) lauroyltransferase
MERRRGTRADRLRNLLQAAAARTLLRLLAWLPLPVNHALGTGLGTLLAWIPNELGRTAATNIGLCFPRAGRAEQRRLTKRALVETAKTATELGPVLHWPGECLLGLIREVTGEECLDKAMASGRGVIIAVPHLGCWELVGLYCSARTPLTIAHAPPRLESLRGLLARARGRFGGRLVPASGSAGLRQLYRSLAAGGAVAVLPDQDPGRHRGLFAPFFGIAAKTSTLLVRLARHCDTAVVFCYAERMPRGQGFRMHFRTGPSLSDLSVDQGCAVLNACVEALVAENPEQYQWCYRRFRSRPEGSAPLYPD